MSVIKCPINRDPPKPRAEPTHVSYARAMHHDSPGKEEMIQRAEEFLNNGCVVVFPGVPRSEVLEILAEAHQLTNHEGLERMLRACGAWKETE